MPTVFEESTSTGLDRIPGRETHEEHAAAEAGCPLRVVVVDDNSAFQALTADLIGLIPAVELVGLAGSGEEALDLAREVLPDVVLMDLSMPGMNGLQAARALRTLPFAPDVLLMSVHEGDEYRDAATTAGARAFVPKSELVGVLPGLLRRRDCPN